MILHIQQLTYSLYSLRDVERRPVLTYVKSGRSADEVLRADTHRFRVYENFRDLSDTPNDWGQVRDNQFFKFNYALNKLEFTTLQSEVEKLDFSTVTAQSFIVTSDENAKKDIEMYDCSQSVDIMNEIDMLTYCYKKGDPTPKLGVIAQTVEKLMPYAVKQGKQVSVN